MTVPAMPIGAASRRPGARGPTSTPARSARGRGANRSARKQRLLSHKLASLTRSIAEAVSIKDGEVFFVAERDGNVPLGVQHGAGLYYHDCRYLDGYELRLGGEPALPLASRLEDAATAAFLLTNPELADADGVTIVQDEIGIEWTRTVDGGALALRDRLVFRNHRARACRLPVSLAFRARFEDVHSVRAALAESHGRRRPPVTRGGVLELSYRGRDGLDRSVTIAIRDARLTGRGMARLALVLPPRATRHIEVEIRIRETPRRSEGARRHRGPVIESVDTAPVRAEAGGMVEACAGDRRLQSLIDGSRRDLDALRSRLGEETYFAAGLPWFAALFGRDSLITALEMLAFDPALAASTLRLLARYQGTRRDPWRDEEPGKIPHELRVGEIARLGEIPHTPYYGSVDATPLFLMTLAQHVRWTGSLELFHRLRGNVDRALAWIDGRGDSDRDGYVDYRSASEAGLIHQGWKDSGDAIVNADGSPARHPIALIEVQAYVYRAKRDIAALFERSGEPDRAARLRREAEALRERFRRDFWCDAIGGYAMALQAGKASVAVASSNPGHALWAGIADRESARLTAERLMTPDLFTGWGVRTLSAGERAFNLMGYHVGSVWPHDNALIVSGFRRYGLDHAAARLVAAMLEAADRFPDRRLPELFAGISREDYDAPVPYLMACHPHAPAAASVPMIVVTCLGLVPDAFERRLHVVRPMLPEGTDHLELRGLAIGEARVDLRLERDARGRPRLEHSVRSGELEVVVEAGDERQEEAS